MSRPYSEPRWCTRDGEKHTWTPPIHRSKPSTLGTSPRWKGDGQVTVWLHQTDGGPAMVGLTAAHMASVSIDLGRLHAIGLRDALNRLLREAGWE